MSRPARFDQHLNPHLTTEPNRKSPPPIFPALDTAIKLSIGRLQLSNRNHGLMNAAPSVFSLTVSTLLLHPIPFPLKVKRKSFILAVWIKVSISLCHRFL
ncbi:hypothetical protein CDAR_402551 [Caerostris darwini]|uniref:Uncharacterized protein n=1 Tax=Caerostris darwini TaxID=1538125 RepID=A0AAV4RZ35_9ARAC|nr:hypothetical protein CDAR_402551 [Caerostris darwini]